MSESSLIRRRLIAHGDVQGVFFRDSTRREARAAGVAGWAANRPDGTVVVVLEGPTQAVERLVAFVESGPGRSQIDRLEVHEEAPEGLEAFAIRPSSG